MQTSHPRAARRFGSASGGRRAAFLALGLSVLALAACSSSGGDPAAASSPSTPHDVTLSAAQRGRIGVVTARDGDYRSAVEANGVVAFDDNHATAVVAPMSGRVTELLVAPGDKVQAGQALALVDSPDYAAAVGAYRKALIAAKTARALADMDADLAKHDGVAQREAAQAKTDAVAAEADRESARQALLALNVDPAVIARLEAGGGAERVRGTIRAPIAGTVAERSITVGELLAAGTTPCFTVADLTQVWVLAQVFGNDPSTLAVGDTATIDAGFGTPAAHGTLTNISSVVDPDTRAVTARITVANAGGALRKGMYVRARIQSRRVRHGILVPVAAVLRDDENLPFVYVATKDGSFARRGVTLGERTGEQYVIDSGLAAGEDVVSDGGIFLHFMQTQ